MALDWWTREKPTKLWARRYGGDFALAKDFLVESEAARVAREAEITAKRRAVIRRWRLISVSASALALSLIGAFGFMYFAYMREDVRYYKTFNKRFGEPFGTDELSVRQIRHRKSSLKLVRKGFLNSVHQIKAVDADGNCMPNNSVGTHVQSEQDTTPLHECRWEYDYDINGQIVHEKAYDKEGQLQWGFSYTPSDQQASSRTAFYVGHDGFPARFKNSLAEIVRFKYSDRGYETQKTYTDLQGHPEPGPAHAYGQKRDYDEQGRETLETSLDQSEKKMNNTAGNATWAAAYDRYGNFIDGKALDKEDRPALSKAGFGEFQAIYDEVGNQTSVAYFDRSGLPAVNKGGVHLIKTDYDEKGRASMSSVMKSRKSFLTKTARL